MAITCPAGTAGRPGGRAAARSPRRGPRSVVLPPRQAARAAPAVAWTPRASGVLDSRVATRTGPSRRAVNSLQGERRPARRARVADRGQVTPADQAAARVGEGRAGAAARALGVKHRADALPAVAQAALVPDVPAGRRHLEDQGRAVLRRAGQGPRVGQVVQAVEPAAAPPARRRMPAVPHATRVADGAVDAGRAQREAGEAGRGAVRGQHGVRQLVAGEGPVRALVLGGPAWPRRKAGHRRSSRRRSADGQRGLGGCGQRHPVSLADRGLLRPGANRPRCPRRNPRLVPCQDACSAPPY